MLRLSASAGFDLGLATEPSRLKQFEVDGPDGMPQDHDVARNSLTAGMPQFGFNLALASRKVIHESANIIVWESDFALVFVFLQFSV